MKNKLYLLFIGMLSSIIGHAQTTFDISGYADTYWKYDFADRENIGTYFGNDHNSISLGMLALGLNATAGKASFVGELSLGPRGQYLSLPKGDNNDPGSDFHIQNLYINYNVTDKLGITAGYMGTFVGYEVIAPTANFHYSTSYLFGAGPFQNAGLKVRYAFTDKISAMAGVFNDWNVYQDLNGLSHFGAQLALSPTPTLTALVNLLTGTGAGGEEDYSSGTLVDVVLTWSATPKLILAGNAADYRTAAAGGYYGLALYPQYHLSDVVALGIRGEYFAVKPSAMIEPETYLSATLSANIKHGGLTLIPEIRLDDSKEALFLNKAGGATKNAAQTTLALLYEF